MMEPDSICVHSGKHLEAKVRVVLNVCLQIHYSISVIFGCPNLDQGQVVCACMCMCMHNGSVNCVILLYQQRLVRSLCFSDA